MIRWPLTTSSGDVMDDTGGKTLAFKKKHTHTNVKAMTSFQLDMFFFLFSCSYASVTFAVVLGKRHISANGAIFSKRTMLHRLENRKRLGASKDFLRFHYFSKLLNDHQSWSIDSFLFCLSCLFTLNKHRSLYLIRIRFVRTIKPHLLSCQY